MRADGKRPMRRRAKPRSPKIFSPLLMAVRAPNITLINSTVATGTQFCIGFKMPKNRRLALSGSKNTWLCWLAARRSIPQSNAGIQHLCDGYAAIRDDHLARDEARGR